jgi:hypothetical protein
LTRKRTFRVDTTATAMGNTGRSLETCPIGKFDPFLPFNIGPMNGREARESGL